MDIERIKSAIVKAQNGIAKYTDLMNMFEIVDVSCNPDFQRKYNAFYRVKQRPQSWYEYYYGLMQQLKGTKPNFSDVLDAIHLATGRYEPSFASKLVATIDPTKPIWDKYVLQNINHPAPKYTDKQKLSKAKTVYTSMESWYAAFLQSTDGQRYIREFDDHVPNHSQFSSLQKIDFILWQMRP